MKSILSLWTLSVYLINSCNSMDRHRNKICYKAMTCIHTGQEKCGIDGKGSFRRFYDSCDILEFNCLKGKDYIKTAFESCALLDPIDDAEQEMYSISGNNKKIINGVNNLGNIEGVINVDDEVIDGQIKIDDDLATEQPGKSFASETAYHGNQGVEGQIVINERGSAEGTIVADDVLVEGDNVASSVLSKNPDESVIKGVVQIDDEGNDARDAATNEEEKGQAKEGEIKGDVQIDEEGNVAGGIVINEEGQEQTTKYQEDNQSIEGSVQIDEKGNIAGDIIIHEEEGDHTYENQEAVDGNVQIDEEGNVAGDIARKKKSRNKTNENQEGIDGDIQIDEKGNVAGDISINENSGNQINYNQDGIDGDIQIDEDRNVAGDIAIDEEGDQAPGNQEDIEGDVQIDEEGNVDGHFVVGDSPVLKTDNKNYRETGSN